MLNFKSIALLSVNVYYIEESVLVTAGSREGIARPEPQEKNRQIFCCRKLLVFV